MKIYLESSPDFYQQKYDQNSYDQLIDRLSNKKGNQYVCITDKGLNLISSTQAAWERFKGFFGFSNAVQVQKVKGEWLKLVHYGLRKGYLNDNSTLATVKRVNALILKDNGFNKVIDDIVEEDDQHDKIAKIRQQLLNFFRKNRDELRPSFWNRRSATQITVDSQNFEFGDTYLALISQAQDGKRDLYLKKATSTNVSMGDEYSERLESEVLPIIEQDPEKYREIYLRLAQRDWERGDRELVAEHLKYFDNLNPYYSYLKFICSESKDQSSLEQLPPFDDSVEELRTAFVEKLILLGDEYVKESQTIAAVGLKLFTFGYVDKGLPKSEKAWEYYLKASLYAQGSKRQEIQGKMNEIAKGRLETFSPKNLELAEQYFAKKDWENAAHYYSNFLKERTPDELVSKPERIVDRLRFAQCLVEIYKEDSINQKHLKMLDEVILAHGKYNEETIESYINEKGTFISDQESMLYYLKGLILEKLRHPKSEVLKAYEMAVRLAPNHPWGAMGYFAEDGQTGKDDLDALINAYKKLAIEWGVTRDLNL